MTLPQASMMMRSRLMLGDDFSVRYVRQGGVWTPRRRGWWIAWGLTGLVALALLASAFAAGLASAHARFDAESRGVANEAALRLATTWTTGPALSEGCLGGSEVGPWPGPDMITARYSCPIKVGDGEALAAMALRDTPYGWRLASLYVIPAKPAARSVS